MKKPLYSGICFSFMAFVLVLFSGCGNISEDELLPAYTIQNSPYHFTALFTNKQDDTLGLYDLEMGIIGSDRSRKGISFSYNSGGIPFGIYWKTETVKPFERHVKIPESLETLVKSDDYLELELPKNGPFEMLLAVEELQVFTDDEPGKEHKSFGHKSDEKSLGINLFKKRLIYQGQKNIEWNKSQIAVGHYIGEATFQEKDYHFQYWFHREIGYIRSEFTFPVNQQYSFGDNWLKLVILQLPKTDPSQPN